MKKGPKSSIFEVPDRENFFDKLSIKKLPQKNVAVGDLPIDILGLIFEKTFLRFLFENKSNFGFLGNLQQKPRKNSEKSFFEKGHKIPMMDEAPDRNFW